MPDEDQELPDPLTVTYRATLHYEGWEVDEFQITEDSAISVLESLMSKSPGNMGEFEINRGLQGLDGATDGVVLDTEWVDSTHGVFWVRAEGGRIHRQTFEVTEDTVVYEDEYEYKHDNPQA